MVMNLEKRRLFTSLHPHGEEGDSKQMTSVRKCSILRTFIRNTVGPILPDIFVPNPYSVDQNTGGITKKKISHKKIMSYFKKKIYRKYGVSCPSCSLESTSQRNIFELGTSQMLRFATFTIPIFWHFYRCCAKPLNEVRKQLFNQ
jgi:hypothetical protein